MVWTAGIRSLNLKRTVVTDELKEQPFVRGNTARHKSLAAAAAEVATDCWDLNNKAEIFLMKRKKTRVCFSVKVEKKKKNRKQQIKVSLHRPWVNTKISPITSKQKTEDFHCRNNASSASNFYDYFLLLAVKAAARRRQTNQRANEWSIDTLRANTSPGRSGWLRISVNDVTASSSAMKG